MSFSNMFKEGNQTELAMFSNEISVMREDNSDILRMGDDKRRACCKAISQKDSGSVSMKNIQSDPSLMDDPKSDLIPPIQRIMSKQGTQITLTLQNRRTQIRNLNSQLNIGGNSLSRLDIHGELGQGHEGDLSHNDKYSRGMTEDEKLQALKAEQRALVKNSQYEKLIQTKSDIKQQKIHTMLQALNLVVMVASFLNSIRQYGQQYKFKRLKENQFSVIGDKTSNYSYYFENKYFIENYPSKYKLCLIQIYQNLQKSRICNELINQSINQLILYQIQKRYESLSI